MNQNVCYRKMPTNRLQSQFNFKTSSNIKCKEERARKCHFKIRAGFNGEIPFGYVEVGCDWQIKKVCPGLQY